MVGNEEQLYLPFIDFPCVAREAPGLGLTENTTSVSLSTYTTLYEYVSFFLSPSLFFFNSWPSLS